MPHPKEGYFNRAGDPIPGTTEITGRYMDRSRLLFWAFARGKQGHKQLYDNGAIDVGTAMHAMIELDLQGRSDEDIKFYVETTLRDPDQLDQARIAFKAYRKWRA